MYVNRYTINHKWNMKIHQCFTRRPYNCLNLFDHFVRFALKVLKSVTKSKNRKTNPRNISCWKVFLYALLLLGKRHTCKYFCVISQLFSVERSYSAGGQTRGSAQWYLRHYCGATHTTNLWRSWKGTHGKVWYVVVDWIFIIVWNIE